MLSRLAPSRASGSCDAAPMTSPAAARAASTAEAPEQKGRDQPLPFRTEAGQGGRALAKPCRRPARLPFPQRSGSAAAGQTVPGCGARVLAVSGRRPVVLMDFARARWAICGAPPWRCGIASRNHTARVSGLGDEPVSGDADPERQRPRPVPRSGPGAGSESEVGQLMNELRSAPTTSSTNR